MKSLRLQHLKSPKPKKIRAIINSDISDLLETPRSPYPNDHVMFHAVFRVRSQLQKMVTDPLASNDGTQVDASLVVYDEHNIAARSF